MSEMIIINVNDFVECMNYNMWKGWINCYIAWMQGGEFEMDYILITH